MSDTLLILYGHTMNKLLMLNEHTTIDFHTGDIMYDDRPTGKSLTEIQSIIVDWLASAAPNIALLDSLAAVWCDPRYKVWDMGYDQILSQRLTEINNLLDLGAGPNGKPLKINKRKKSSDNGYQFNTEIKLRWITPFSLQTLEDTEIFQKPEAYQEPEKWLEQLSQEAFIDEKKVHAISGERGIGKTDLARFFAAKCAKKDGQRYDLYFKHVVFTPYLDQGLEETIALLKCYGEPEETKNYTQQKINLLKELPKPSLLIIANYDNEENYLSELSRDSEIYRALRATGCHILFTSNVNLRDCYALNQTRLKPLPTQTLTDLFFRLADEVDATREEVTNLIEHYLMSNTYLVRLAARLMETRTIEDITQALDSLNLNDITDPINGKDSHERSLFNHFVALFGLSYIKDHPDKCRMLYNLALLPLEGIPYKDFMNVAFEAEELIPMQTAFNSLKNSFWVFLKHQRISMQPLVREMLTQKVVPFKSTFIQKYVRSFCQQSLFPTYDANMSTTLKQCSAAYVILEKLGEKNLDTASLAARLCASYDILSNQSLTYVYGKKAYQLLEDIAPQVHSDAERYQLGQAYSRIGYAILHVDKKYDSKMYAENALTKATGILSSITNQDQKVKQLYTLTMGNVAALAMKNHDYKKALEIHQDNLKLRQDMLGLDATVDNKRLVASSCKGIGTAYFYRAQEDDSRKEEFLSNAYEFHSLSVQHYEELYAPEYDFTIAIADNRKIGTLCQLMEYLDPETQKKRCKEALERMEIAHDYLMQMEPKNEKELQNTRNNIAFLSERLEKLH